VTLPRGHCGPREVVLEVTWSGTFTGPWATLQGEVEPTSEHQTSRACVILSEGNSIKESRHYFDSMSLMQQPGMLEAPASL
jgi:hypothetical protein